MRRTTELFKGIILLMGCLTASFSNAQPAEPTSNVLTRVLMVQSKYDRGTTFSLDVDGREYWITAKHILTGAQHPPYGSIADKTVDLRILNPGGVGENWLDKTFTVIDPGKDVDIVILAASALLLGNPLPSAAADSSGIRMGSDCEFLGFPFGGGWKAQLTNGQSVWFPLTKHCTVSAWQRDGLFIWILDGINNQGFSGGPVLSGTGPQQKIIGVVSGFISEPIDVIPATPDNPNPKGIAEGLPKQKEKVNVNSGFIIAFDIGYVIDAVRKNPIGPVRAAK